MDKKQQHRVIALAAKLYSLAAAYHGTGSAAAATDLGTQVIIASRVWAEKRLLTLGVDPCELYTVDLCIIAARRLICGHDK